MWEELQEEGIQAAAVGDYDSAIDVGGQALAACESELGRETIEYARCMLALSSTHHFRSINDGPRDSADEAVRLSTEAYAIAERIVGKDDPRMMEFATWRANALTEVGELDEATDVLAAAVAMVERAPTVDEDGVRVLGSYASLLNQRGLSAERDAVMARRIALHEAHIVSDPDRAWDHRYNLGAAHNSMCFYLRSERPNDAVTHAERSLDIFEQCHDDGHAMREDNIDLIVENARAAHHYAGSELTALFEERARNLLRTPGPMGMWEAIAVAISRLELPDDEVARGLLQWLRGDGIPESLAASPQLPHLLGKLRKRFLRPGSTLLATFPMSLDLVARGQGEGDEPFLQALELCAAADQI